MANDFVSPLVHGLQQLLKCDGYPALESLYQAEEMIILRDLSNAIDDRALTIIQGRYKMLKHLRHLPEETIDKYLNSKKTGG